MGRKTQLCNVANDHRRYVTSGRVMQVTPGTALLLRSTMGLPPAVHWGNSGVLGKNGIGSRAVRRIGIKAGLGKTTAVIGLLCLASPGIADQSYQLVAGDRVSLSIGALGMIREVTLDVDGQMRLPETGTVQLGGLSLDAAEKRITTQVQSAGLFTEPGIALAMLEYAPIIVAGDVGRPGRFAFAPGMTVSSAVALAGGALRSGVSLLDIRRANTELTGRLAGLNHEIGSVVALIARLETPPDHPLMAAPSERLLAMVPDPEAANLQSRLEEQADLRAEQMRRRSALLAEWETEIEALQARVQGDDPVSALQALAEARRDRSAFLSKRIETRLAELAEARFTLETLRRQHATAAAHLALLSSENLVAILASEAFVTNISIHSARPGRADRTDLTENAKVLPGDTVIVSVDLVGLTDG